MSHAEQRERRERLRARSAPRPASAGEKIGLVVLVLLIVPFAVVGGPFTLAALLVVGIVRLVDRYRKSARPKRFARAKKAGPRIRPVPEPAVAYRAGNPRVQRRTLGDHRTVGDSPVAQEVSTGLVTILVFLMGVVVTGLAIVLLVADLTVGISAIGIAGLLIGIWFYGSRRLRADGAHGKRARRASLRADNWLIALVGVPLLIVAMSGIGADPRIVAGGIAVVTVLVFGYLRIRARF